MTKLIISSVMGGILMGVALAEIGYRWGVRRYSKTFGEYGVRK